MKTEKVTLELENLVPPVEAARLLGIHRQTLWRWVREGKILSLKAGGKTLIPQSEIERLK